MGDITDTLEELSADYIAATLFFLSIITFSILAFFVEAITKGMVVIGTTIGVTALFVVFPQLLGKIADRFNEVNEQDEKKLQDAIDSVASDKAKEEGKGVDGVQNAILMG